MHEYSPTSVCLLLIPPLDRLAWLCLPFLPSLVFICLNLALPRRIWIHPVSPYIQGGLLVNSSARLLLTLLCNPKMRQTVSDNFNAAHWSVQSDCDYDCNTFFINFFHCGRYSSAACGSPSQLDSDPDISTDFSSTVISSLRKALEFQ